jgi:hypothetical protein
LAGTLPWVVKEDEMRNEVAWVTADVINLVRYGKRKEREEGKGIWA